MNGFTDIWNNAKETYNHTTAQLRAKAYEITGTPTVTVEELAEYIQKHPETRQTSKKLLDNTYFFYHLIKEDFHFYLETFDFSILQLDVSSRNNHLVSYRSYRDQYKLNDPIRIPELLLD